MTIDKVEYHAAAPFREELLKIYHERSTDDAMKLVNRLQQQSDFAMIYASLTPGKTASTESPEPVEIAREIFLALDQEAELRKQKTADEGEMQFFFSIAEQIKKQFNEESGKLYLDTTMPNDLIDVSRKLLQGKEANIEEQKLSEKIISSFKEELDRIAKGRQAVSKVLQKYSKLPISKAQSLAEQLHQLQQNMVEGRRYLVTKTFFQHAATIGSVGKKRGKSGPMARGFPIFDRYVLTAEEPPFWQLLEFRYTIEALCAAIKKNQFLPDHDQKLMRADFARIWRYRAPSGLSINAREILEDTLKQANIDKNAIEWRLAQTFVKEYKNAEQEMKMLHDTMEKQLADTTVFLQKFDPDDEELTEETLEKIKLAEQKVQGLDGIFNTLPHLATSKKKPYLELERTATGISTHISSEQIVSWIATYSILYSNTDFLAVLEEPIGFSNVRKYISDLSTYHLIQNIGLLRGVIDSNLQKPAEEKKEEFKKFNELLKLKLQNLMKSKQSSEKSITDLTQELGFIHDDKVQFVIAETFQGFQALVEAFNNTTKGQFVKDRDAMIKESNGLYEQICSQCLKNFVHVNPIVRAKRKKKVVEPEQKKGFWEWIKGLLSR